MFHLNSSLKTNLLSLATLVIVTAVSGCQTTGSSPVSGTGVAASGVPLRLWHFSSLNPDCTPFGEVVVRVLKAPEHGSLVTKPGEGFSNFDQSNPRHQCNLKRTPGMDAVYTPRPGYTGPDSVSINRIAPDGSDRQYTANIVVK